MITHEHYDSEMKIAYSEIGKLKAQLEICMKDKAYWAGVAETHIKRLSRAEEILDDHIGMTWCQHCDEYTTTETKTIKGNKGHIDNWLQDESIHYCESCGRARE